MADISGNEKRKINLDLLRITSMLMIPALHMLGHGGILKNVPYGTFNYYFAWFVRMLCVCAVNCYVLVSGYFLISGKFRLSKLAGQWGQVVFYSVVCYLLAAAGKETPFRGKALAAAFLPVITRQYWFYTRYVVMYLMFPFLNMLLGRLTRGMYAVLLAAGFAACSILPNAAYALGITPESLGGGYSIIWFLYLYAWGAYLRLHSPGRSAGRYGAGFWLCVALMWLGKIIPDAAGAAGRSVPFPADMLSAGYNAVLVFGAALCLFCSFSRIKITCPAVSRIVSALSPLAFGVYLLHDNNYVREWLWNRALRPSLRVSEWYFPVYFIGTAALIYGVCSFAEYLRRRGARALGNCLRLLRRDPSSRRA